MQAFASVLCPAGLLRFSQPSLYAQPGKHYGGGAEAGEGEDDEVEAYERGPDKPPDAVDHGEKSAHEDEYSGHKEDDPFKIPAVSVQ